MIEVRSPRSADLPELEELYREAFGYAPPEGFWAWKYGAVPGQARQRVALNSLGHLVAHAGALGLPGRWSGGEATVWQLVDFMGSTSAGGLRSALVEAGRDLLSDLPGPADAPWIFGFPSERHFRLGRRTFGYLPLREIQPWFGPLPAERAGAGVGVEISESCGAWAEAIWSSCAVRGIRRSPAFLNWRYYARPERYYRFYRLRSGSAEGLAVFGFTGNEAHAAELWLPEGPDWAIALRAAVPDLVGLGMASWKFWPLDAEQETILRRLGARPDGETVFVGCRGRMGGRDPVSAAEGFVYAMGDYDLA